MTWLDELPEAQRALVVSAPAPRRAAAMKAVLSKKRFSDPKWIFERKLDGIRCIAIRDAGGVRLLSRNDLAMNGRYPEIAAALERQPCERFAIDGEVVAMSHGQTSFSLLAQRGQRAVHVLLYAFDVLWLDGYDVRALPLRVRKRLLRERIDFADPLRWTSHRNERGEELFAQACARGWEGLIAKRADSPYVATRSHDWLKFKCEMGQEMVIGGFTAPRGAREELGALLVGHYAPDGTLRYAGKVGTGFTRETLVELGRALRARRRDTPPFADPPRDRTATWVAPELVAQIGFTEWTRHGRLRHPRFLGLRDDKPARDVVREA